MSVRLMIASAALVLLASPAFADCKAELAKLDEAVIAAETGHTAGIPATPHQEQLMQGEQPGGGTKAPDAAAGAPEAAAGSVQPTTPHQQQTTGAAAAKTPGEMVKEANDLAAAGDEAGCMAKVTEVQALLGSK